MARGEIELTKLTKEFAEVRAVDAIDLHVPGGEFFSLLGPSGCGKTTTLRMIAGFERPTSGQIVLDGTDVAYTPPHQRNVNTVFQNYALFPHLNVYDNIAFGLKRAKRPKAEIRDRVGKALELVQLSGYERRKSSQLSGGQQQRVALARALILNPAVLLLDEPLGALDAKLRKTLQIELKALQQEVGITFLYVTHDQEEALTMSDRLAVFNAGRIEQVGSPADVYEHPQTEFVAGFVGVSNVLERITNGRTSRFTVRPEKIRILAEHETPEDGAHTEGGEISEVVYVGMVTRYSVALDEGGALMVVKQNLETTSGEALEARGRRVRLAWRPEHTYAIEQGEEEEINE
jgi:putative spermidine/putrescine transport system ATP-binding protein